ncbi:MAG: signal peptide peptidase SppA [Bacteroidetes bacterium]|nr:signal peptide peptidase SppA [Bacteroidota bacterium]
MRFLGNVLATITGLFIFCIISFFGLLVLGALLGGSSETVTTESNSVLVLDLSKVSHDYAGKYNFKDFDYFDANHDGLINVIHAIKTAANDPDIQGISILNDASNLGLAQIKAVRKALEDFKKSKKFVLAYNNNFSQKEYYLNSVADQIYMNPVGDLEFKGLSSELLFFKDFQDKYGVKMEVIRHGKYKSAVEPFLENKMSDANREQITELLNSVWNEMLVDISRSRKISAEQLNDIAAHLSARTPQMAKDQKLIDVVTYEDVYHDHIRKLLHLDADEKYNSISVLDYAQNLATTATTESGKDKIAVIYAQGDIGSGEGDVDMVGEGSMRRALQEARADEKIKAVVLRVDSPGGSALTSELIWREVELTKKVKPVVVSMGNLAASGGYYISCGANRIFAENTTITGSIGVFGLLPNFHQLTNNLGIHAEQVATHPNANEYSVFSPLADNNRFLAQEGVEKIYSTFVQRVAAGRKMTFEQVDAIGQGRVWSGADALKIGLVDQIGGLPDAVAYAASISKTKNFKTLNLPVYEKDFHDWLGKMGLPFAQSKESLVRETIGDEGYRVLERIRKAQTKKGIQAALPYEIEIH